VEFAELYSNSIHSSVWAVFSFQHSSAKYRNAPLRDAASVQAYFHNRALKLFASSLLLHTLNKKRNTDSIVQNRRKRDFKIL